MWGSAENTASISRRHASGSCVGPSGVRTNHHATPVQLDSLMDRARGAGLRVATATDYDVLPRLFLRRRGAEAVAPIEMTRDVDVDSDSLEEPVAHSGVQAPDADLASLIFIVLACGASGAQS